MASPAMTPPPGMQDQAGPPPSPTENASPPQASPAPPQPSPHIQMGARMVIQVVSQLREIAKAFPGTAPAISEINDKIREVMKGIMSQGAPGEAAAPPTGA